MSSTSKSETRAGVPDWILIVEDSVTQALRLRRVLECAGYLCGIVGDGAAALHAMSHERPSLVISDIVMPAVDGYELCRRMRADPRLAAVPVILLTSLSDPRDIIVGLEAGADNFIMKPCDEELLLDRVRYILASRALLRQGAPQLRLEVSVGSTSQTISSERAQILSALFASCELAGRKSAELRSAKEDAERASRAKTELLARVGHELRTPLNAILGFSQLAAEEPSCTGAALENLEQIRTAGARLLRLAEEMIDVSRVDMGEPGLRCEPVQWVAVLEECLKLIQPLARQRAIKVRCDLPPGPFPPVLADSARLGEVLVDLLSHAVECGADNSVIVIEAEHEPARGFLRLKVTDEGPAIPEAKLKGLFPSYERLGADGAGGAEAGLGLALSERLLEAMGGAIGTETIEGRGSAFWIELPTWEPAEAAGVER